MGREDGRLWSNQMTSEVGMTKPRRPLKWLKEAPVEEIGEALLSLETERTASIMAYMAVKGGPEIQDRVTRAISRLRNNPHQVAGRMVGGLLSGLFRDT